jgi:uncharacterized membrane protein YeiH
MTGVDGDTVRDLLTRQVPSVLSMGLCAIPVMVGRRCWSCTGNVHLLLG